MDKHICEACIEKASKHFHYSKRALEVLKCSVCGKTDKCITLSDVVFGMLPNIDYEVENAPIMTEPADPKSTIP